MKLQPENTDEWNRFMGVRDKEEKKKMQINYIFHPIISWNIQNRFTFQLHMVDPGQKE